MNAMSDPGTWCRGPGGGVTLGTREAAAQGHHDAGADGQSAEDDTQQQRDDQCDGEDARPQRESEADRDHRPVERAYPRTHRRAGSRDLQADKTHGGTPDNSLYGG